MKLSDKLRQDNDCGDFGRALEGYAEEAEKLENSTPKIKMTKALPTEVGSYYWTPGNRMPIIVYIDSNIGVDCPMGYFSVSSMGGYWSKVDQSQFEFED